jgi:hypothetical protein
MEAPNEKNLRDGPTDSAEGVGEEGVGRRCAARAAPRPGDRHDCPQVSDRQGFPPLPGHTVQCPYDRLKFEHRPILSRSKQFGNCRLEAYGIWSPSFMRF